MTYHIDNEQTTPQHNHPIVIINPAEAASLRQLYASKCLASFVFSCRSL